MYAVYAAGDNDRWSMEETTYLDDPLVLKTLASVISSSPQKFVACVVGVDVANNVFSVESIFCNGFRWEGTQFIDADALIVNASLMNEVDFETFLTTLHSIMMRERNVL